MMRAFSCVLACAVLLTGYTAFGQSTVSDLVTEFVTNHHVDALGKPVDIIPGLSLPIPEPVPGTTEGELIATIPPLTIDFYEDASSQRLSDRLHLNAFQVRAVSDDVNGLLPRSGSKIIPASANEAFLPVSIFVHSEGENPNNPVGGLSDHITITLGFYGTGTGTVFLDVPIPEPTPGDPGPEPGVDFLIPPMTYDVVESPVSATQIISDYFDHSQISGYFISSDDPAAYDPTLIPDGKVFEDGLPTNPFYGGDAHYALGFVSDTEVPEPVSLVLASAGLFALGVIRRARTRVSG